jgi:hypothetical protein
MLVTWRCAQRLASPWWREGVVQPFPMLSAALASGPCDHGGGDAHGDVALRRRYALAEKTLAAQSRAVQALRDALHARDAKHAEEKTEWLEAETQNNRRIAALQASLQNLSQLRFPPGLDQGEASDGGALLRKYRAAKASAAAAAQRINELQRELQATRDAAAASASCEAMRAAAAAGAQHDASSLLQARLHAAHSQVEALQAELLQRQQQVVVVATADAGTQCQEDRERHEQDSSALRAAMDTAVADAAWWQAAARTGTTLMKEETTALNARLDGLSATLAEMTASRNAAVLEAEAARAEAAEVRRQMQAAAAPAASAPAVMAATPARGGCSPVRMTGCHRGEASVAAPTPSKAAALSDVVSTLRDELCSTQRALDGTAAQLAASGTALAQARSDAAFAHRAAEEHSAAVAELRAQLEETQTECEALRAALAQATHALMHAASLSDPALTPASASNGRTPPALLLRGDSVLSRGSSMGGWLTVEARRAEASLLRATSGVPSPVLDLTPRRLNAAMSTWFKESGRLEKEPGSGGAVRLLRLKQAQDGGDENTSPQVSAVETQE